MLRHLVHPRAGLLSTAIGKIGEYSYSIYLRRFFIVFHPADWLHRHLLDISNFYVALPVSLLVFLGMVPIEYLSIQFVEAPFLRLRKPDYDKQ